MYPVSTQGSPIQAPPIQSLFTELRHIIFSNLSGSDAARAGTVCKMWNEELADPILWSLFLEKDFHPIQTEDPRGLYAKLFRLDRNLIEGNSLTHTTKLPGVPVMSYAKDGLLFLDLVEDLQILDMNTGYPKVFLKDNGRANGRQASTSLLLTDQNQAIAADSEGTIRVWNTETGDLEKIFETSEQTIDFLFLTNDRKLISCSWNGTVIKSDLDSGKLEQIFFQGVKWHIRSCCISKTGDLILGCSDHKIRILNTDTGELKSTLTGHEHEVVSLSQNEDSLASRDLLGTVMIWDLKHGGDPKILREDPSASPIACLHFTETGKLLSCDKSMVKIWNVSTERCEKTLPMHADTYDTINFVDGKLVLIPRNSLGLSEPVVTIQDFTINSKEKIAPSSRRGSVPIKRKRTALRLPHFSKPNAKDLDFCNELLRRV